MILNQLRRFSLHPVFILFGPNFSFEQTRFVNFVWPALYKCKSKICSKWKVSNCNPPAWLISLFLSRFISWSGQLRFVYCFWSKSNVGFDVFTHSWTNPIVRFLSHLHTFMIIVQWDLGFLSFSVCSFPCLSRLHSTTLVRLFLFASTTKSKLK